jgi:hypothetical protein
MHEELGKLYIEINEYEQSYIHLRECYDSRSRYITKLSSSKVQSSQKKFKKVHVDLNRVQDLLIFLNRKIEL